MKLQGHRVAAVLLILLIVCRSFPGPQAEEIGPEEETAVRTYLTDRYHECKPRGARRYEISGLCYIPEWTALKRMEAPDLRQYMPDVHFYSTIVQSHNYEYSKVETLAAVQVRGTSLEVHVCFSPTFDDASGDFLAWISTDNHLPNPSRVPRGHCTS